MEQRSKFLTYPGPFFLALGAVLGALGYFILPVGFYALVGVWGFLGGLAAVTRRALLVWMALGALLVCMSAHWQVQTMAKTRLAQAGTYAAVGQVRAQGPSAAGYRLLFQVRMPDGEVPVRLRHDHVLQTHGWYQLGFWATPVSGPIYPGGFDPRFQFSFAGVRGFGRLNQAVLISAPDLDPASAPISTWQTNLRLGVDARIRAHLPDQRGAVASALLTGYRGGLDEQTLDLFRAVGLSHLLAISGLHLSLLAGVVFALVRSVFWAIPMWNLYVDQRKAATLVAMMAAVGYFFLSGAAVPTQRALVLVLVAGVAYLAGRRALTWRLWAIALALVLIVGPHHVFSISTHLSFLAVAILIRAANLMAQWRGQGDAARALGRMGQARRWALGLLGTTLAVNVLTIPILLLIFGQAPALGVLANLVAVPFAGAALIPLCFLALLSMPFGMEAMPLALLGAALDLLFWLAQAMGSLSFLELEVPKSPLPLIWPLLLVFGWVLYPGWRSWQSPMMGLMAVIAITTLPLWLPQPTALHHPDGWVVEVGVEAEAGLKSTGLQDISDYDAAQAGRLWRSSLRQATIKRPEERQTSLATFDTGPILVYTWGRHRLLILDKWFRNPRLFINQTAP